MNDFNWLHIVSTLANHRFLDMDKVLDQPIEDVFTYISYLQSKIVAEKAPAKKATAKKTCKS